MADVTIEVEATVAILRHAEPTKLARLAKLLRDPTEERQVLAVAVDAALEAGPIAPRFGFRRGKNGKMHPRILGDYGGKQLSHGDAISCFEGERLVARGDARAIVRRWVVELAESTCARLEERDPRALAAMAAAREHVEGRDDPRLDEAREQAKAAAFEPNPIRESVAARTTALNTTHEDAWEAGFYTASCAAGWLDRPLTQLVDELLPAMEVLLGAHWAKLNEELAARVVAGLG
ncbi:MAG: hypothetical protein ACXVEF_36465 [Polyangiales bacterium]